MAAFPSARRSANGVESAHAARGARVLSRSGQRTPSRHARRNGGAVMVRGIAIVVVTLLANLASAAAQEKPIVDKGQKRRAVAKLREILKGEPTAKEVQTAALRFYKLEPERLENLASAARLKGLVPEIELGADNSIGHTFTNTRDGLYPSLGAIDPVGNPQGYKERVTGSQDQLLWRVRAVWNLDRLVFNAEALDVRSLTGLQENLVREVTTLYFSRRRLIS